MKPPQLGELDLDIMKAFEREISKRLRDRQQMRRSLQRMIDEKFGTIDVRLGGLDKKTKRNQCLQEDEDVKKKGKCVCLRFEFNPRDERSSVPESRSCASRYELSIILILKGEDVKNRVGMLRIRFEVYLVKAYKDEEDEDKDEIKGLI
ncbi:hypothetical protein Tco_0575640 [Tanacetum coccineum]